MNGRFWPIDMQLPTKAHRALKMVILYRNPPETGAPIAEPTSFSPRPVLDGFYWLVKGSILENIWTAEGIVMIARSRVHRPPDVDGPLGCKPRASFLAFEDDAAHKVCARRGANGRFRASLVARYEP
ncbi:uncharacterized protein LY79DRAFT_580464 [Colletotrichum navitas]|uniref:Uncharacterized protein n=1 Tax=Colletotrichum navitas TaxID=681940 RepID=A0AAD8V3Z3_9PEZI|nr:uncharacterized protein LY79DRAFT_580464 [Colletotrichum navitas]KAK1589847.1 hypothetical protein LY79DRAFT_580464 [Colletotrichum navitas]